MPEFTMPSLGADMDEGTLLEWLVRPGDRVRRGDVVAVVDTEKSNIEVECFTSGTVERLLVDPGTTVPVGTPLAVITAPEEAERRPEPHPAPAPAPAEPSAPAPERAPPRPPSRAPQRAVVGVSSPLVRHIAEERGVDLAAVRGSGAGGRVTRVDVERAADDRSRPRRRSASPLARRLAEELHIDLTAVPGTGRNGTVRADDVRQAATRPEAGARPAPARPSEPPPARRDADRTTAMRRSIAELMSRSKREIPHYYLSTTIDVAAAMEWMRERNRHRPVGERLVPAAMLLKATALAARQVPDLNGFWTDDRFVPGPGVHLGVAVALRGGGLVAPALHDADRLTVPDLMAGLKDLVARARAGRLRGSETADPTITVTSLGDQGVEAVFGVIYPPQVALVGVGRVMERPAAVDGLLGVRPCVTATLSADHRASDGAVGARFLAALDRLLQTPEEL